MEVKFCLILISSIVYVADHLLETVDLAHPVFIYPITIVEV